MSGIKEKIKKVPILGDILIVARRLPKNILLAIKTRWFYFKKNHQTNGKSKIIITDNPRNGDIFIPTEDRGFFSIIWEIIDHISVNNDKDIEIILNHSSFNDRATDNMWEYYFEPIKNINKKKIFLSYNFRPYTDPLWPTKKKNLMLFNKIINDRIKIKNNIVTEVDSFVKNNFKNKNTIGVQCRGTNIMVSLNCVPHLFKKASVEEYFKGIDKLLQNGYNNIFLATDDERIFRKFKEKYPTLVTSYSKNRSESDRAICLYYSKNMLKIPGKFTPRELGQEVLIDGLLLSRCDYLLHGESNVSTFATFFNPNIISKDLDIKYKSLYE